VPHKLKFVWLKSSPTKTATTRSVVTAQKAKTHNRNGSIHGFALIRKRDGAKFPDWDLELKPGIQEFVLKVPDEPGEYQIVCTVICSDGHEDMHMKIIVIA
jgi:hypothetical protein